MRLNFKRELLSSRLFFFAFLLLSIIPLFFHKYYVSLDGPQHLYNANILVELLKGNSSISEFFKINSVIVGYWSGHFFLAFFRFFFSAWLAEKLFIMSYIVSIAFSFRYLINSVNKENNYMSILIFPFAYSMYFMMGYYSFSIAFIPFFLTFGYLIRHSKFNKKNILIFGLLLLFSFLSHAFVFALTGISIFLYTVFDFIFKKIRKEDISFKSLINRLVLILISAIPAIVLWIVYIKYVMSIDSTVLSVSYSFKELTYFLLRIRQLVAFHHDNEAVGNIPIFNVLMILLASILIRISYLKNDKRLEEIFSIKNIWFIISFFFLALYYFLPDRISAGSLTNRIGLMFFFTLIITLSMQKYPKIIVYLSTIILLISFIYLQNYRTKEHKHLNEIIQDIHMVEDHIKANSVLYAVRNSDNWFDLHFPCYVGIDKAVVNLKSPQNQGQFPIVWNYAKLPILMLGNKRIMEHNPAHMPKSINMNIKNIDYVLIYHKHKEFKLNTEISENLNQFYKHIYTSPKGYADLYMLK